MNFIKPQLRVLLLYIQQEIFNEQQYRHIFILNFNTFFQEAVVLRDGKKLSMNAEQLVVGDIVYVKFGDRLPADIRVIESKGFKV